MKVSIVIPAKNGARSLPGCLEAISMQSDGYDVETIVVDSGSVDGTVEVAERYGAIVKTIPPESFTHGYARNLGAFMARGEVLVFCNQDAVPANRDWLGALLEPFSESFVAGSYSRQLPPARAPCHERVFLEHLYPVHSHWNGPEALQQARPQNTILFSTVSGALRREVWQRFRFNEDVIMSEDQEIACKIILSGYRIAYAPRSAVYHFNDYSLTSAFQRYFDSGWSMAKLPRRRIGNVRSSAKWILDLSADMLADAKSPILDRISGLAYLASKTLGFSAGQFAPSMPESIRSRISYTRSLMQHTPFRDLHS